MVRRAERKRNAPVRRPVHPHRGQGAPTAVEVGASRPKSGAHLERASNRAWPVANVGDRALVENWAACWCKRKSMNTQTMRSKGMVAGVVEVGSVVSTGSRHETASGSY